MTILEQTIDPAKTDKDTSMGNGETATLDPHIYYNHNTHLVTLTVEGGDKQCSLLC